MDEPTFRDLCALAGRLADAYHDHIEEILEKVEERLATL